MKKVYVFLADGFEDVEALIPIDVWRRGGIDVTTVSISDFPLVQSAHGVNIEADIMFEQGDFSDADLLFLPGGMPGATNLFEHKGVCKAVVDQAVAGKKVAAICASPAVVLAPLAIIRGRQAVCYPGMEAMSSSVNWGDAPVAVDDNVVTGNGPAAATLFALTIVAQSLGHDKASEVASGMLFAF